MPTRLVHRIFEVTSTVLLVAHLLSPAFMCRMPLAATSSSEPGVGNALAPDAANDPTKGRLVETLSKLPLRFEETQEFPGTGFKFVVREGGIEFGIKPAEVVTRLQTREQSVATPSFAPLRSRANGAPDENNKRASPKSRGKTSLLRTRLVGANRRARVMGESQLATRSNYFISNDPKKWRKYVPNYERVRVEQVYPGVDVVYYSSGERLEYDFNVAPGADYKAIRLRFISARSVRIDRTGDLEIETPAGLLRHRKPVAYQQFNGARKGIAARYHVNRQGEVQSIGQRLCHRLHPFAGFSA